jgi:DNA-binding winged helix-turn-helix (wHTH) protein/Tol biopolymer transport system component
METPEPQPVAPPESGAYPEYQFGRFRLSVPTRELRRDGVLVPLTAKTFDTLVALVQRHGRVVSKDDLMRAVWSDAAVSDDSLTQNIKALRRALGDDAAQPEYIATLSRRGYRFLPPVIESAGTSGDLDAGPAEDAGDSPSAFPPPVASASRVGGRPRGSLWWGAAAAAAALAVGIAVGSRAFQPAAEPSGIGPLRLTLAIPHDLVLQQGGAVAPDGRAIAYVAAQEGRRPEVWLTDLQAGDTRRVSGTGSATRPFWSPDGRSLGFFADGSLKTVPVSGGASRTLAMVRNGNGGSWAPDGRILFADLRSPILAVGPSGGEPVPVTALDAARQEVAHLVPQVLPDGRRFLYYVQSANPDTAGTYVGSLDSDGKTRVLEAQAVYAAGALVFVRDRVLFAQRFDSATYQLAGEPVAIAGDVVPFDVTQALTLSASGTGLLSYGVGPSRERLVWVDRTGATLDVLDTTAPLYNPTLSADGRQLLAASRPGSGATSIWAVDLAREVPTRLTEGMRPVASPDGRQIAYTNDRETGIADIYLRPFAGSNQSELLVRSRENKMVNDWTRDGGALVYASTNPGTKADLWILPLTGGAREPRPFLQTPANELQAQLSPDNRWIAYASDETGTFEVYLQSFPDAGGKQTVSVGGGTEPHWRADGRELYYVGADGAIMAVGVGAGPRPQLARPTKLFRLPEPMTRGLYVNNYDVSADGERFLLNAPDPKGAGRAITLVVNWPTLLAR